MGYEDTEVKSLGFYRYMCAERPEDNTGKPSTGDEQTGGETTDNEGTQTGDGTNTDKPLDETLNDSNELNSQNNDTEDVDDDEDKLSLILIILVCILVPLVMILGAIVYLFRKNK